MPVRKMYLFRWKPIHWYVRPELTKQWSDRYCCSSTKEALFLELLLDGPKAVSGLPRLTKGRLKCFENRPFAPRSACGRIDFRLVCPDWLFLEQYGLLAQSKSGVIFSHKDRVPSRQSLPYWRVCTVHY